MSVNVLGNILAKIVIKKHAGGNNTDDDAPAMVKMAALPMLLEYL